MMDDQMAKYAANSILTEIDGRQCKENKNKMLQVCLRYVEKERKV